MSESKNKLDSEIRQTIVSGYQSRQEENEKNRIEKKDKRMKTYKTKRWQLFWRFLSLNFIVFIVAVAIISVTIFNDDLGDLFSFSDQTGGQEFNYSRNLVLGISTEENLIVANREDSKIEILKYFELNKYQKQFEFELANPFIDLESQIVYMPNNGIYFVANQINTSLGGVIELFNNAGNREELYKTNNIIWSISEGSTDSNQLVILESERTGLNISTNNYEIRLLDLETNESTQISALKSEKILQLERVNEDIFLTDISREDCYLFKFKANVDEILTKIECSEIQNDISNSQFIITSKRESTDTTDTDPPVDLDSFPENKFDFRQTIISRQSREEVYVGEMNNLLEIVAIPNDEQRLFVFSKDIKGRYYKLIVINTAINKVVEEFDLPQVKEIEFLKQYKPDKILIFKSTAEDGLPPELLVFNLKNYKFYQMRLPTCERGIDICDSEVL